MHTCPTPPITERLLAIRADALDCALPLSDVPYLEMAISALEIVTPDTANNLQSVAA